MKKKGANESSTCILAVRVKVLGHESEKVCGVGQLQCACMHARKSPDEHLVFQYYQRIVQIKN